MSKVPNSERSTAIISRRFDRRFSDRSRSRTNDQASQIAAFRSLLETEEFPFAKCICPCGGEGSSTVVATIDRYGLPLNTVVCETCGTLRFDPYLDGPSVERFYTEYYQSLYGRSQDLPAYFSRQTSYGQKILRYLNGGASSGKRVLEIGCGAGGALSAFADAGWDCVGCEYDGALVAYARTCGLDGVRQEVLASTLERLGPHSCDLVFSHHVFEHVWNPEEQLRTAAALLKPNGLLLHIVPDILGIDRSDFPAGDALQYLHIAHIYNYTPRGLEMLAGRVGMLAYRVTPPTESTPWSHASEMWIEFAKAEVVDPVASSAETGELVRKFLQRTEFKFRYSLCRPQWRNYLRLISQKLWGYLGQAT